MKMLNKHILLLLLLIIVCDLDGINSGQASEKVLISEKLSIEGKILRDDNDTPISNMIVKINIQGIPNEFDFIDKVAYSYTNSEGYFSFSVYAGYYINTYTPDGTLFSTNGPFKFSYYLSINWGEDGLYNDHYNTKTDNIGYLNSDHYRIYHLVAR